MSEHAPDEPDDDSYAEGTPLTNILGDHPKVKIIAALLGETDRDVNKSDLARLAGISRSAVYSHLDDLISRGIVTETRESSGHQMYQLNLDATEVELLAELEKEILKRDLGLDGESYGDADLPDEVEPRP